jgi:hypothetical protein
MKSFYISSLLMAAALIAALVWTSSDRAKLAVVDQLHAVGYLSANEYEQRSSAIDPARKFFKQVGAEGMGPRVAGGAKFLRIGD